MKRPKILTSKQRIGMTKVAKTNKRLNKYILELEDKNRKLKIQLNTHRQLGDEAEKELLETQSKLKELQTEYEGKMDAAHEALQQQQTQITELKTELELLKSYTVNDA